MRSKVSGVGKVGGMGIVAQVVGVCDGSGVDSSDGGSDGGNMVGNGLSDMVSQSPGLEQGLVIGSLGLNNRFLGEDGLMFNDGVGNMLDGGNCARDSLSNGGGLMNIGGFSNR